MHGLNGKAAETAVLLLGHGSRAGEANEGMYEVVARLRAAHPDRMIEAAFLEINAPSIPEGIDICAASGARQIVLLPYFLHLGNHVLKDMPRFVEEGRRRHPGREIVLGPHLGFHEKLVEIVEERLDAAITASVNA